MLAFKNFWGKDIISKQKDQPAHHTIDLWWLTFFNSRTWIKKIRKYVYKKEINALKEGWELNSGSGLLWVTKYKVNGILMDA